MTAFLFLQQIQSTKKLMVYFVMVAGFIIKISKRHNPIMKKIISNINAEAVIVAKKTN